MTVINTQYSTLEEAWGTGNNTFQKKHRECDLYEKSSKSILRKPHRQNTAKEMKYKNMMLLDDDAIDNEDYDRYHGYSDSRKFSRTSKPLKKHRERPSSKKSRLKKKVVIDPLQNTYHEPEIEHNEYQQADDYIYEEVFEEDEDNYLAQETNSRTRPILEDEYVDEEEVDEESYVEEEETKHNIRRPTNKVNKKQYAKDSVSSTSNQILDLSIYTLSGIILIFMMEQFVQIGIGLKT
jgi:hypothetical protein